VANTTGKKFAGRVKGTPNKRSLDAIEMLGERKHPFEFLIEVMNNDWKALGYDSNIRIKAGPEGIIEEDSVPINLRVQAGKEAIQYLMPKRKAIEHTGGLNNTNTVMTIESIIEKLEKGEK
jgi:hypothetical protein